MPLTHLEDALLFCLLFNYGVLLVWFAAYQFLGEKLWQLHRRYFDISRQQYALTHYAGMAIYKIGILLLNLAPWLAITLK